MTWTTAYIHTAATGRHHVTDDSLDYLDESGPGFASKADAQRAASVRGYSHVKGQGFAHYGTRIPRRYQMEDSK